MMWTILIILAIFIIIVIGTLIYQISMFINEKRNLEKYLLSKITKKFNLIEISNIIIIKKSQRLEIYRYTLKLLKEYFYPMDLDIKRYKKQLIVLSILRVDDILEKDKFEKFKRDYVQYGKDRGW